MPVERYRIKEPTIAMSQNDGRGIALTVSTGSVVEVAKSFVGDKLVDVKWEGRVVMMFTQDLRLRAERIA